jgi:hypothetical protein
MVKYIGIDYFGFYKYFYWFILIKIRVPRGIGQFSLRSDSYGLYALIYDPYRHGRVTTTSKR